MTFTPFLRQDSLDDLMRDVLETILEYGKHEHATRGPFREITGVVLELTNPRARLSRTEVRGKPFSCVGELCWYLARSDSLEFIEYYLPKYKASSDGKTVYAAYGPRLFDWRERNQVDRVLRLLRQKDSSRRAVIQLFDLTDLDEGQPEAACTCTLQFLIRDGMLHTLASMRSNDAFWGVPHDFFCFTMLQEILARSLGVDVGSYKHMVGSLHLYDEHRDDALAFLNEGFQATDLAMPPMPAGDPWTSIETLLKAERLLRTEGQLPKELVRNLDDYWADLVRLLKVLRLSRDQDAEQIQLVRREMSFQGYDIFVEHKLPRL